MKRRLSLCLALLLLFSLAGPACAFGDTITSGVGSGIGVTVTLTRLGEAEGAAIENADCEAAGLIAQRGGMQQLLDWRGVPVSGSYDLIDPLCDGYWLVYQYSAGANCCGLMRDDGTLVIPVSAAIIKEVNGPDYVNRWQAGFRYIEVVYAGEALSGNDGAYLYVGYTPYSGYSLYYDLLRERFVGELRRESASESPYSVSAVGDKLFFGNRGTVYDENGAAVLTDPSLKAERDVFVRANGDGYSVLDSGLRELARFPDLPNTFGGDSAYFKLCENNWYRVVDRSGRQLGELRFFMEPEEWGNFFVGMDDSGRFLAMDHSGRTVLSAADDAAGIDWAPCGFVVLSFSWNESGLLCPDGTLLRGFGEDVSITDLLVTRRTGGRTSVLVLDDKDFSLTLPEGAQISLLDPYDWGAPVLAVIREQNGICTLVNLVNGEALMKVDCSDVYYRPFLFANGCLYALNSDTCLYEVYRVDIAC